MPIKLYLDENVNIALASALRRRGFDVVTARERGTLGADDREQIALAASEGRTILTHDVADYIRLHQQWLEQKKEHAGIIDNSMLSLAELVRRTTRLLGSVSSEELRNHLLWLS